MTAESGPHGVIGFGYEGADQDAFVTSLTRSGIGLLVDVRLNAVSRKRGFSKRGLAQALADGGIGYEHAPELGNPGWNRAGFSGSDAELTAARDTYRQLIQSGSAPARLDEIAQAAATRLVAVLCVESDERHCHRYVVLSELRARVRYFARAVG
jgi:uncharacterized protein (DUF488 family)